jgi:VanZ family protein
MKNRIQKFVSPMLFKTVLLLCIIVIEYLATTTLEIKIVANNWDKLNHFVAFFVLYILSFLAYQKMKVHYIVFLLLLFAVQIEVVQYFIPNRYFSLLDVVADGVGIGLGYLFIKVLNRVRPLQF